MIPRCSTPGCPNALVGLQAYVTGNCLRCQSYEQERKKPEDPMDFYMDHILS